jgi:hypothetical protein
VRRFTLSVQPSSLDSPLTSGQLILSSLKEFVNLKENPKSTSTVMGVSIANFGNFDLYVHNLYLLVVISYLPFLDHHHHHHK